MTVTWTVGWAVSDHSLSWQPLLHQLVRQSFMTLFDGTLWWQPVLHRLIGQSLLITFPWPLGWAVFDDLVGQSLTAVFDDSVFLKNSSQSLSGKRNMVILPLRTPFSLFQKSLLNFLKDGVLTRPVEVTPPPPCGVGCFVLYYMKYRKYMACIHEVYLPWALPRRLILWLGLINQHAWSQRQMPTLMQSTSGAEDWGVEDPVLHIWLM